MNHVNKGALPASSMCCRLTRQSQPVQQRRPEKQKKVANIFKYVLGLSSPPRGRCSSQRWATCQTSAERGEIMPTKNFLYCTVIQSVVPPGITKQRTSQPSRGALDLLCPSWEKGKQIIVCKKGAELVPYPPHKQQGDDHHGEHVQDYKLPSRLHLSIEILIIFWWFLLWS